MSEKDDVDVLSCWQQFHLKRLRQIKNNWVSMLCFPMKDGFLYILDQVKIWTVPLWMGLLKWRITENYSSPLKKKQIIF